MTGDHLAAAWLAAAGLLDRCGVRWWACSGVVLGAVRDGVILGDDLDVGVWRADLPAVAGVLRGLVTVRPHEIKAWVCGVKLDVHGHERAGGRVRYRCGPGRDAPVYGFPAWLWGRLEPIEVYGRPVLAPAPVEEYLVAHYGPGWRTPRPGWDWRSDPTCVER